MAETLKGADFVALKHLTNLQRETVAAFGETCERVNPSSLAPLLDSGHIARIGANTSATLPAGAKETN